jgi:hypothetical protein
MIKFVHNPADGDENCTKFAQHILKVLHHQYEITAHTEFTVIFMMYLEPG